MPAHGQRMLAAQWVLLLLLNSFECITEIRGVLKIYSCSEMSLIHHDSAEEPKQILPTTVCL